MKKLSVSQIRSLPTEQIIKQLSERGINYNQDQFIAMCKKRIQLGMSLIYCGRNRQNPAQRTFPMLFALLHAFYGKDYDLDRRIFDLKKRDSES